MPKQITRGRVKDESDLELPGKLRARDVRVGDPPRRRGPLLMVPDLEGEPQSERIECIGELIAGKYRLESEIGSGGMGVVYKAYREDLHAYVALKLLRPAFGFDPQTVARFLQEARMAAALKSPHVARVQDFGTLPVGVGAGARPYIVMEYLHGQDLGEVLKAGPVGLPDAIDYLIQASHAIAEAHARGIVHRDLKPANLFRNDEGDIKVMDFGIAKPGYAPTSRLTRAGLSLGSPHYMSPEQIDDPKLVDSRADIYSFGVCLYELLTATVPFDGQTFGELVTRIVCGTPTHLEHLRPDLPIGLAAVVHRAFAREPSERFPTIGDFVSALAPYAPPRSRRLIELLTPPQAPTPTNFVRAASASSPPMPPRPTGSPTPEAPIQQQAKESMPKGVLLRRSTIVLAALALILLLFAGKIWTARSVAGTAKGAPSATGARPPTGPVGVLQANLAAPEPLVPPLPAVTVSPLSDKALPLAGGVNSEPARAQKRESIARPRAAEPVKGVLNLDNRARQ